MVVKDCHLPWYKVKHNPRSNKSKIITALETKLVKLPGSLVSGNASNEDQVPRIAPFRIAPNYQLPVYFGTPWKGPQKILL